MDLDYRFELYKDRETNEFVVKYFDMPVIGAGNTIQEAINEARDNLSFYLDFLNENNESIPIASESPFSLEYSGRITLRVSKTIHRKITSIAEKEGISLNSWLNQAISMHYQRQIDNGCIKKL